MIPQGLDLEATDRRLLSSTHDQSSAPPDGERDDAFEFEQVSLLRLGRGHTPVDAELGDLEPHFAQFAYDQDLEVFGCELRQFQHPSSPSRAGPLRRRGAQLSRGGSQREPGRCYRERRDISPPPPLSRARLCRGCWEIVRRQGEAPGGGGGRGFNGDDPGEERQPYRVIRWRYRRSGAFATPAPARPFPALRRSLSGPPR